MKVKPVLIITAAFMMMGTISLAALILYRPVVTPLRDYGSAPAFQLTNMDSSTFDSKTLAGKIWVADFIFTNCPGPCPTMTANMAKLHKKFDEHKGIKLVSISVDPERDTPQQLIRYATKFGVDPNQWSFLTGPVEEIVRISAKEFMIGDLENPINHSTKLVLVDTKGRIRGYYEGTSADETATLIRDIKRLLRER